MTNHLPLLVQCVERTRVVGSLACTPPIEIHFPGFTENFNPRFFHKGYESLQTRYLTGMNKSIVVILAFSLLAVAVLALGTKQFADRSGSDNNLGPQNSPSPTIQSCRVHNLNTGLNYTAIQTAIDANETLDGHTILVDEGEYCEHVVVHKAVCLSGRNRDATIINGNGTGTVVNVTASNVKINGFTIENGYWYSLVLDDSIDSMITDNVIRGSNEGLGLHGSSNNTVSNNSMAYSQSCGIALVVAYSNRIANNTIMNNVHGILVSNSFHNIISDNTISSNTNQNIELFYAKNTTILNNVVADSRDGIAHVMSWLSEICNNSIVKNRDRGIYFEKSYDCTIFHNDFINNTQQIGISNSSRGIIWDGGYPCGGNYWSDYNATDLFRGIYQNETGSDGIGDRPYVIDGSNEDRYPFLAPDSKQATDFPINQTEFQIISKGYYSGHTSSAYYVIQNQDSWANIWNQHQSICFPKSPPPEVNFSETTVIAVFMGECSSGGYGIEIKEILTSGQLVAVKVEKTHPGNGCIVTEALTQPFHIVKIDKTGKQFIFDTTERTTKCS